MTTTARTWTRSLEDSVFALGAAARECQNAARAAALTTAHYDLDRLRLLDGRVARRREGSFSSEQEPHLVAISQIGTVHLETKHQLERLYQAAADAYAFGANWAVRQVQAGHEPACVDLPVGGDGAYIFGASLPVPDLDRFSGARALEAAHRVYERCVAACFEAEAIDRQGDISDFQAGEMHAALDVAAGLPDAAYAYGVTAEAALHWALNSRVPSP